MIIRPVLKLLGACQVEDFRTTSQDPATKLTPSHSICKQRKVWLDSFLLSHEGNLPPQSYWNLTGRAYPDIASLATNFIVVENLIPTPGVDGTSCAAPSAAGMS